MERINISFEVVKPKTEEIKAVISTRLFGDIVERYADLENSLEQSGGEGIDAIREVLLEERDLMQGIGNFMMELANFIWDAADAFEDTDRKHADVMKEFLLGGRK